MERADTPAFRSMGQQAPPPGPQGFSARAGQVMPHGNAVCREISACDIVSGAQSGLVRSAFASGHHA